MQNTAIKKDSTKSFAMRSTNNRINWDDKKSSNRRINLRVEKTERERNLEEFNNLERDRVLSSVTHDLRAPLSNVESLIDMIQDSNDLGQEEKRYLHLMRDCVSRMSGMVDGILEASSRTLRNSNLSLKTQNLTEIVRHVFDCFARKAQRKNIKLHFEVHGNGHQAKVDRNTLIQSLENLVCNALKFSDRDKEVFIRVVQEDALVRIEVEDQGPGISSADQQRMFAPFQKLSASPTACESSLGLGLSLAKGYVEQMNGELSCSSKIGTGTTFSVSFKAEI